MRPGRCPTYVVAWNKQLPQRSFRSVLPSRRLCRIHWGFSLGTGFSVLRNSVAYQDVLGSSDDKTMTSEDI